MTKPELAREVFKREAQLPLISQELIPNGLSKTTLFHMALVNNYIAQWGTRTLFWRSFSSLEGKISKEKVVNVVNDLKAIGFMALEVPATYKRADMKVFAGEEFVLIENLRADKENDVNYDLVTINKDIASKFFEAAKEFYEYHEDDTAGTIFIVQRSSDGQFYLSELGRPVLDFKKENYMPEIVEAYERLIKELPAKDPFGRLAIIEGVPGTGKTSMIRSLITNCNDTVFVIFPSQYVPMIEGPEFVRFLANQKDMFEGKPLTLILEDADICVAPRGAGNMSYISAMLNAADGIIGACVDTRIIATTNAKFEEMDPALVRPGRLLQRISINKLSPEQATVCLRSITKGDEVVEEEKTLAEVYEMAYKVNNGRAPEKKERRVGF